MPKEALREGVGHFADRSLARAQIGLESESRLTILSPVDYSEITRSMICRIYTRNLEVPNFIHHNNIDALLWLQSSAEWRSSFLQAYELAKLKIDQFMSSSSSSKRYCITTDLDETLLDNSAYNEWLATSGRNFNETGSWAKYCQESCSLAMPGVEEFYGWLAAIHPSVKVFFVTSRLNSLRDATATNLRKIPNVPAEEAASTDPMKTSLFMKEFVVKLPGSSGSDKYIQYEFIERALGFETIVRLGDNASDFSPAFGSKIAPAERLAAVTKHAEEWGRRWIQFPNPVYGSFLLSLKGADDKPIIDDDGTAKGMTDDVVRQERTEATTPKVRHLNPWQG